MGLLSFLLKCMRSVRGKKLRLKWPVLPNHNWNKWLYLFRAKNVDPLNSGLPTFKLEIPDANCVVETLDPLRWCLQITQYPTLANTVSYSLENGSLGFLCQRSFIFSPFVGSFKLINCPKFFGFYFVLFILFYFSPLQCHFCRTTHW